MWHEWSMNAYDVNIMMMWFTLYADLVISCLACMTCACIHGRCDLCRTSESKYLSYLACMQADLNLTKITTSHFWVLNTQNSN